MNITSLHPNYQPVLILGASRIQKIQRLKKTNNLREIIEDNSVDAEVKDKPIEPPSKAPHPS